MTPRDARAALPGYVTDAIQALVNVEREHAQQSPRVGNMHCEIKRAALLASILSYGASEREAGRRARFEPAKWREVACPTCGSKVGNGCTKQGFGVSWREPTSPHAARIRALAAGPGGEGGAVNLPESMGREAVARWLDDIVGAHDAPDGAAFLSLADAVRALVEAKVREAARGGIDALIAHALYKAGGFDNKARDATVEAVVARVLAGGEGEG